MNFGSSSTQGSILINLSVNQSAGTTIEVVNEERNSIMSMILKNNLILFW